MREFRFYHADRLKMLVEGQSIVLSQRGLSRFGECYWDAIANKDLPSMSTAELREYLLEQARRHPRFANYASRMQCMFAANSIEEAQWFARSIDPKPDYQVPIFEVYASKFWTLDMKWTDYKVDTNTLAKYCNEYWYGSITNHAPAEGDREVPRLEVLMALPVKVGRVVAFA